MSRDFCPYPHELEHWECKIRYLGQIPTKAKTVYAILHQMFSSPYAGEIQKSKYYGPFMIEIFHGRTNRFLELTTHKAMSIVIG